MNKALTLLLVYTTIAVNAQYSDKDVRAYVDQYSMLAVQKMKEYKIPASITMAQAILESACGTSRLAREGNNHFGIKCHKEWNGDTLHKNDDSLDECFRKYDKVEESFDDHSLFLTTRYRYNALFQLDIMDYKAWARGLKAAGYATNPQYPTLLINLIERYQLSGLDSMTLPQNQNPANRSPKPAMEEYSTVAEQRKVAGTAQLSVASPRDTVMQKSITPTRFTATEDQFPKENYPFTDREV
ncbi:MAG: glucosaminidase domain-containing protein [Bacteroidales bacterium]|jgi:flagellum-specific peptidoglycan hydrolase FlgJ|nr:glucosaminidase domain-containing protein [Bacteroidales bacterium]